MIYVEILKLHHIDTRTAGVWLATPRKGVKLQPSHGMAYVIIGHGGALGVDIVEKRGSKLANRGASSLLMPWHLAFKFETLYRIPQVLLVRSSLICWGVPEIDRIEPSKGTC